MRTKVGSYSSFSQCLSRVMDEDKARAIWRNADAVCFDVDSTVCVDEGIDELAAFMGVGDKVAAM